MVRAGPKTSVLGVVIVAITIFPREKLEDDCPIVFHIDCKSDLGIVNIRWAKVALRSYPMRSVIRICSLAPVWYM